MDAVTVAAYDTDAATYCEEWLRQPPPADLQDLWRTHLVSGAVTADIGSGSGRDADWLTRHGFPCDGFDASVGLVAQAKRRFPDLRFGHAQLPALAGIADAAYSNVICETVIMHLPEEDVSRAIAALCRILAPGGVLFLSWRVGDATARDGTGRLYSAFSPHVVRAALSELALRYDREETSLSSSKRVHRIIARKAA